MTHGYTLIELLVVVLIVSVLCAIAVPQYFNAAESARMVELKVLWGQQKRWASGKELTDQQRTDANEKLQKYGLKYFTGEIICREESSAELPCFEAVFTRNANARTQYQISTVNNFQSLACIPTNWLGTRFCKSRSVDTPLLIDNQEAYLMR
ncbi:MAG: prepilin-type N-terminal cleavage/methylation domain-containing protein [Elusimicrobiaceae bacterium]|nr:prepilin-type N-terminal cleavage/methylation domain-containing protein [Elusimicrobiaceae bacterium]